MKNLNVLFINGLSRAKGILITSAVVSAAVVLIVLSIVNSADSDAIAIKLGFIDRDGSAASADLGRYMTEELGIELVFSDNTDEMNSKLVEKRVSGLIEVPAGFEAALLLGDPDPVLLTFMGDYANEVFTRSYVESYMKSLGALAAAAGGDAAKLKALLAQTADENVPVSAVEKDEKLIKEQADKDGYRVLLGFFMMFSFIMSICISTMLFADRMEGTYRRIRAGRVTAFEYTMSIAMIGLVLMLLINGPSLALYALSGSDPGVPMLATAGLLAAFSLFVIAFGLLIGLVMPSHGGIVAVIIAVTTITSMLGGAWFPIDLAPQFFQTVGHVTPQYWFFEAVSSWQTGAGSPVGPTLIILLAAALCFVLAGVRFTGNKGLGRV